MGAFNATITKIKIGGTAVEKLRDCSLDASSSNIETTSKDSAGWKELIYGLREWGISGEALVDYLSTVGYDTFMNAWINRTVLTVEFTTGVTGDTKFTGSALVSSIPQSAPLEDVAGYSFELEGSGVLTAATI